LSPWTRLALVCLLGALALGLVVALVYIGRLRRARVRTLSRVPLATPPSPMPVALAPRSVLVSSRAQGGGAGGGLALASPRVSASVAARMACPSCRREFEAGVRFCSYDARRLVPLGELAVKSRAAGSICPRCRRGFEAGVRACPHDSEELMAMHLWEAAHGKRDGLAATGVVAKICPQCTARYDLAMCFCGRDGAELMTIN